MKEIFKPIITKHEDYTGFYEVSNFGEIKSLERKVEHNNRFITVPERIIKPAIHKCGYYHLSLNKETRRKNYDVHTLVWDAFGNHKRNGRILQVDHIDNNKLNNCIDNLQLLTNRENCSKGIIARGNTTSKYLGVGWNKNTKKWRAKILINGKQKHLGLFNSEQEASKSYQDELNILTI